MIFFGLAEEAVLFLFDEPLIFNANDCDNA